MSQNPVDAVLAGIGSSPSPEVAGLLNGSSSPNFPIIPPPAPPAPKLTKAQAKSVLADNTIPHTVLSGMKKFGYLATIMGDGIRVRVKRRAESGHLVLLDDYSKGDIDTSGDIETFLNRWIRPTHGGGIYQITLISQRGEEAFMGDYRIDGPEKDTRRATSSEDGLTAVLRDQMTFLREQANKPQPLPPDPLEQIKKAQAFVDQVAPKNDSSIFAMMMQMQQQSSQQMMALLAPKTDPAILALLEKTSSRLDRLEQNLSAPPMVAPMPPPPPPGPSMVEILTAIGALLPAVIPLIKGKEMSPIELMTIVQNAQAQSSADKLSAKELIAIFAERERAASPPMSLVEQMQMLASVREFAASINPPSPAPQGASFWDALISFAGNQSIADGLARRIAEPPPPRQLPPERVHVDGAQRPQPAAPQQPAQQQVKVEFPPDFPTKCQAIAEAQNPAIRLGAVIEALQSLTVIEDWRPFLSTVLEIVARGDADKAHDVLGRWLGAIVRNGMLPQAAADAALSDFKQHFELVREEIFRRLPQLRALAAPAPAPVPPPPGSTPAENVEVQTGPAPAAVELAHDPDVDAYTASATH